MTGTFVAGLLAGYGVAVPVGAIAVLVMSLAARTTFRVGAAAAMGVATADGAYAALAVLGGAALAELIAPAAGPLRWLAAVFLVLLAIYHALAALRRHREPVRPADGGPGLTTSLRAYLMLLALTLLNPMTVAYFAALVLGGQAEARWSAAEAALFVGAAFVASASWQLFIAAGGTLLGRWLRGTTGRLVTTLSSSLLIGLLAILLVLSP